MFKKLYTVINNNNNNRVDTIYHHFFPALSFSIALENGLPINKKLLNKTLPLFKKSFSKNYVKWTYDYPADYDDTIILRNLFDLLNKTKDKNLKLFFSKDNGVYTYLGGKKSRSNNSVDFLINVLVLEYLYKNKIYQKYQNRIKQFLLNNIDNVYSDISKYSKYYLSEGYLIYRLSKISDILNIDIDKLINNKLKSVKNKTDLALMILSSFSLSKKLVSKFNTAKSKELYLFQHKRLNLKFRCPFFEEVVIDSALNKINNINFDSTVSRTYSKLEKCLYDYRNSANTLNNLIQKYGLIKNKIVELGVGTGNLISILCKKGYSLLGVDISKDMLYYARLKTKLKSNVKYSLQNAINFKIKPVKLIYTHNFVDLTESYFEIWSNNLIDSKKILSSISNNIVKNGFLFIHKKERKHMNKKYRLINTRIIKNNDLINIYFYEDREIILLKKYIKTCISKNVFINLLFDLKFKFIEETNDWCIFKKYK